MKNANERPGFHTIMATLGKLYARCKSAGGKSRGFGMTSVSSDPALSSHSASQTGSFRRKRRGRTADIVVAKRPFASTGIQSGGGPVAESQETDRLLSDDYSSRDIDRDNSVKAR